LYDPPVAVTRIGLLGGTFDPPHIGHLVVASEARYRLGLDEVLLLVAHDPWQKSATRDITPAPVRYDMVVAAADGHPGIVASRLEIDRGGATYTADTVDELVASQGPTVELVLILGADTAAGLPSWHRSEDLRSSVSLAVVPRDGLGVGATPPGWRAETLQIPRIDVSSSEIRRRCAAGEPVDGFVAPGVRSIIESRGLYGFRR
jgi:nicotinate-nucleotide adenylyltransferase